MGLLDVQLPYTLKNDVRVTQALSHGLADYALFSEVCSSRTYSPFLSPIYLVYQGFFYHYTKTIRNVKKEVQVFQEGEGESWIDALQTS